MISEFSCSSSKENSDGLDAALHAESMLDLNLLHLSQKQNIKSNAQHYTRKFFHVIPFIEPATSSV